MQPPYHIERASHAPHTWSSILATRDTRWDQMNIHVEKLIASTRNIISGSWSRKFIKKTIVIGCTKGSVNECSMFCSCIHIMNENSKKYAFNLIIPHIIRAHINGTRIIPVQEIWTSSLCRTRWRFGQTSAQTEHNFHIKGAVGFQDHMWSWSIQPCIGNRIAGISLYTCLYPLPRNWSEHISSLMGRRSILTSPVET